MGLGNTVQLQLDKEAYTSSCNKNKETPFYKVYKSGLNSTVKQLLHKGANINLSETIKESFLSDKYQIKEHILTFCNNKTQNPLLVAVYWGHDRTMQLLNSKGANVNLRDNDGKTPLLGVEKNKKHFLLLSKAANFNLCVDNKNIFLHIASGEGHTF